MGEGENWDRGGGNGEEVRINGTGLFRVTGSRFRVQGLIYTINRSAGIYIGLRHRRRRKATAGMKNGDCCDVSNQESGTKKPYVSLIREINPFILQIILRINI